MSEDAPVEQAEPVGLFAHDIRPNVYEGGFKTWECSMDLARYLANDQERMFKQGSEDIHIVIEVSPLLPCLKNGGTDLIQAVC